MEKAVVMTPDQKFPTNEKAAKVSPKRILRAYTYFEEVKAEFLKISWTEGEEVLTYAKIVVITTFVFGLFLYIADLLIQRVLFGLEAIFKLVVG